MAGEVSVARVVSTFGLNPSGEREMPKSDYTAFVALDPFFAVVMEGLSKFVDGEHYFDTLADDVLVLGSWFSLFGASKFPARALKIPC
jgi:hypothetical protein